MEVRPPQLWTPEDVSDWLLSSDLSQYAPRFEELRIDGPLLFEITDQDLEGDLGVKIRLHRVKILEQIKKLKSVEVPIVQLSQATEVDLEMQESDTQIQYHSINFVTNPQHSDSNCDFLVLKAVEGLLLNQCFVIGAAGASLGRHSASNDIVVSESSISRRHCNLKYNPGSNQFMLTDAGSTTGTFLMVRKPMPLRPGVMFQTGMSEFKVCNIKFNPSGVMVSLELLIYEGPARELSVRVGTQGITIGRDSSSGFCIREDSQISGLHAKVFLDNNQFYLSDVGSTNKTWLRLSPEGERSDSFPLVIGDVLKLGSTVFIVQTPDLAKVAGVLPQPEVKDEVGSTVCKSCGQSECNMAFYPCGHMTCEQCAQGCELCSVCGKLVHELVRLYR